MEYLNLGSKFENIVRKVPTKIALSFESECYSYVELNNLANKYAQYFGILGLSIGDVICLSSIKNIDTFAALVASWKIGVTYSFVDRFSPQNRLNKILNICAPSLILGDDEFIERISGNFSYQAITFSELNEKITSLSAVDTNNDIVANTVAYIMFTSGSTGDPNGVAISHKSIINFIEWGKNDYSFNECNVFAGLNPLFFDNSVFDVYLSLFSGSQLSPINRSQLAEPTKCIEYLEKQQITVWFSVPSLIIFFLNLHCIKKNNLLSLKNIIFGGEGFQKNKLQELYKIFKTRATLYNVYGPTECTCICSSYRISDRDFNDESISQLAPIGELCKGFYFMICDQNENEVEQGEIGELYLGGENVGLGYYGSKSKTNAKFIQNPKQNTVKDIIYKTGDLVRQNQSSGLIYFCGRKDTQVKFMGYRIELGEIEAALAAIDGIQECAVIFQSNQEIVCFLRSELKKNIIKKLLLQFIPSYMIPRKFIFINNLPKNSNGKIDRKKLEENSFE